MLIKDQFSIIQNLQMSPIPQTSNWSWTFFAVSYSKPALGSLYFIGLENLASSGVPRHILEEQNTKYFPLDFTDPVL